MKRLLEGYNKNEHQNRNILISKRDFQNIADLLHNKFGYIHNQ